MAYGIPTFCMITSEFVACDHNNIATRTFALPVNAPSLILGTFNNSKASKNLPGKVDEFRHDEINLQAKVASIYRMCGRRLLEYRFSGMTLATE